MSELLNEIDKILKEAGIKCHVDRTEKTFSSKKYFGIYRHKRCLYFLYYHEVGCMAAIVPRQMKPEHIKEMYDIDCEGDPEDEFYRSPTHYDLEIPLQNGLISGKFSVREKQDFFIDIARKR